MFTLKRQICEFCFLNFSEYWLKFLEFLFVNTAFVSCKSLTGPNELYLNHEIMFEHAQELGNVFIVETLSEGPSEYFRKYSF